MIATVADFVEKIRELEETTELLPMHQIQCQRGNEEIRSIRDVVIQDGKVIIKMY